MDDLGPDRRRKPEQVNRAGLTGPAELVQARDVFGGVHFHGADPPPDMPPRQLPGDVRGFVNRVEELKALNRFLRDGPEGTADGSLSVIAGTAGVGKIQRRLGDRSREAMALDGTGEAYRDLGRPDEAASFHLRATATHRQLGDNWQLALSLDRLATALKLTGRTRDAQQHWREALSLSAAYDDARAAALRDRITEALTRDAESPPGSSR
ncbi:tetratricopeptide repeat protein [Micromonospora yangpuensis]|uniref:Tetratricopeptide repeat-containing protein n=1 Tax=Micromonospora yangpuensis TaxID=683228 RepID=A0A1C6UTS2_9ACTN|nr:tetratricopeptide repeat protein [Micromonospora yangpuensis]GGM24589.1 hypothetical protein GCM10012279_48720 [Micromonospora yangpuensis]SCL57442.1 Tetratricopeptide repeat-containing protein [Micromonospora yangpuensis]